MFYLTNFYIFLQHELLKEKNLDWICFDSVLFNILFLKIRQGGFKPGESADYLYTKYKSFA